MSTVVLLASVFAFVLVTGRSLIRRIPPLLHTPLMSMTNAVSGVTVVGALLVFRSSEHGIAHWLGAVAVAAATFNLVGGFVVTERMLGMFKGPRRDPADL